MLLVKDKKMLKEYMFRKGNHFGYCLVMMLKDSIFYKNEFLKGKNEKR